MVLACALVWPACTHLLGAGWHGAIASRLVCARVRALLLSSFPLHVLLRGTPGRSLCVWEVVSNHACCTQQAPTRRRHSCVTAAATRTRAGHSPWTAAAVLSTPPAPTCIQPIAAARPSLSLSAHNASVATLSATRQRQLPPLCLPHFASRASLAGGLDHL